MLTSQDVGFYSNMVQWCLAIPGKNVGEVISPRFLFLSISPRDLWTGSIHLNDKYYEKTIIDTYDDDHPYGHTAPDESRRHSH